ncbi:MAG: malto-oligosyltrehalose synthase [Verrucomicrobiia bacterium]
MKTNVFNRIPGATYRLQLNHAFTFKQAQAIIPYLKSLGITDIYCSPIFKARPGSNHGYDVCDHNELNPEIGTQADFESFSKELQKNKMGLILDIVPNHMGITQPENKWWMDVLEHGQASQYAHYFDIDWFPIKSSLKGKILLPILGDQYGVVLEQGHLKLFANRKGLFVQYYHITLPINPKSYRSILIPIVEQLEKTNSSASKILPHLIKISQALNESTSLDLKSLEKNRALYTTLKEKWRLLYTENQTFKNALETTLKKINGNPDKPNSFNALDAILEKQYYRLSYWKVAGEEINYRRFFDVNELAAISVQEREVFNQIHKLIAKMIAKDQVTGLRVDHIDGLWNPEDYLERVQQLWRQKTAALSKRPAPNIYLLVEKILCGNEVLPTSWPVAGTTGYEYADRITGVLVARSAKTSLDQLYEKWSENSDSYSEIAYQCKINVMHSSLASEINTLGSYLQKIVQKKRRTRDFTLNDLIDVIRETIACFEVYRTYIIPGRPILQSDEIIIRRALAQAKNRNRGLDLELSAFELLEKLLLGQGEFSHANPDHANFAMKFQQVTGPIMAKAIEDTTFYVYNRLVAFNEVGSEPSKFGCPIEEFHRFNYEKQRSHPHNLITTSTHDTKRSEDVRAQLVALSEFPKEWRAKVLRWNIMNRKFKKIISEKFAPSLNEEYLLYQTLIATLPLNSSNRTTWNSWTRRIQVYLGKAIKEAKINTSWINPNPEWDNATKTYVKAILDRTNNSRFLKSLLKFTHDIRVHGYLKAATQTLLKLTLPGVPDFYQGTEIWDNSLVDPDNRRPVNFLTRQHLLKSSHTQPWSKLLSQWKSGHIKIALIDRLLTLRNRYPALFAFGSYEVLPIKGHGKESVIAYCRRWESLTLIVICLRLSRNRCDIKWNTDWHELALQIPKPWLNQPWHSVLSKSPLSFTNPTLSLAQHLRKKPFDVWFNTEKSEK